MRIAVCVECGPDSQPQVQRNKEKADEKSRHHVPRAMIREISGAEPARIGCGFYQWVGDRGGDHGDRRTKPDLDRRRHPRSSTADRFTSLCGADLYGRPNFFWASDARPTTFSVGPTFMVGRPMINIGTTLNQNGRAMLALLRKERGRP